MIGALAYVVVVTIVEYVSDDYTIVENVCKKLNQTFTGNRAFDVVFCT